MKERHITTGEFVSFPKPLEVSPEMLRLYVMSIWDPSAGGGGGRRTTRGRGCTLRGLTCHNTCEALCLCAPPTTTTTTTNSSILSFFNLICLSLHRHQKTQPDKTKMAEARFITTSTVQVQIVSSVELITQSGLKPGWCSVKQLHAIILNTQMKWDAYLDLKQFVIKMVCDFVVLWPFMAR